MHVQDEYIDAVQVRDGCRPVRLEIERLEEEERAPLQRWQPMENGHHPS